MAPAAGVVIRFPDEPRVHAIALRRLFRGHPMSLRTALAPRMPVFAAITAVHEAVEAGDLNTRP